MNFFDLEASVMTAAHEFERHAGVPPYGIVVEKDLMAAIVREYRKNIVVVPNDDESKWTLFGMVLFPASKPGWMFYLTQEPTPISTFPAVDPSGVHFFEGLLKDQDREGYHG